MPVQPNDIGFYLSGGPFNNDPSKSVGGECSNAPVMGGIGGLFTDVSGRQAREGHIDYRCIYVRNHNLKHSLFGTEAAVIAQIRDGSTCMAGINKATESQRIAISTMATKGKITLRMGRYACDADWTPSVYETAHNIATALNSEKTGLMGVVVHASSESPNYAFKVVFAGVDDSRSYDLVEIVSDSLNADAQYATVRETHGLPINSVAPQMPNGNVEPPDISWSHTSESEKIQVGTLRPNDFFPLWIRRIVIRDTVPLQEDGIVVRITGQP